MGAWSFKLPDKPNINLALATLLSAFYYMTWTGLKETETDQDALLSLHMVIINGTIKSGVHCFTHTFS